MAVYGRSSGAWVNTRPLHRFGGSWTADQSSMWARDTGVWVQVYPDPGLLGSMNPPQNFQVTAGPTYNSVTVGWTNPAQTVQPTNIQIRLAELGAVWTETDASVTAWSWAALSPNTTYVAQIRYVRRVLGSVVETSPIVALEFTTTSAPVGAPAPDPGGTGGDTLFPIDIPNPGGTPPFTSDGCWYEYKIEILSQTSYTWIATGFTGEFDGTLSDMPFDMAVLDPTRVYRLCVRTACDTDSDTIADTWGDWNCGDPFPGGGDWDAVCAGITDSPFASLPAVADAQYRFPKFCKDADGSRFIMIEAVTGVEVAKGPGFYAFFTDADGEQGATPLLTLTSFPFYPTMVAPLTNLPTTLVAGGDWTVLSSFRALSTFAGSDGRVVSLTSLAAGTVIIDLTESTTGWTPSARILTSAGVLTLTGPEMTFDTSVTHRIVVRWDDSANVDLWVDGTQVDTIDVSTTTLAVE